MLGIEIHGDLNSRFLDVNLRDVLPCLTAPETVQWHLLHLEALGRTGIQEFDDPVQGFTYYDSANGVPVSREQVQQMADAPAQIIHLLLLGSADIANLHAYEEDKDMYKSCEYVIQVHDSAYLIIHSYDETFITCLQNSLKGVKAVE